MTDKEIIKELRQDIIELRGHRKECIKVELHELWDIDPSKKYILVVQNDAGLTPDDLAQIDIPEIIFTIIVKNIDALNLVEREMLLKQI